MRERLAKRLGGTPRQHTRLMLAVWSLMHGTAMLIIRGGFEGVLRTQTIHACLDAFDGILDSAARSKGLRQSGPKWPSNLILGEGKQSRVGNGDARAPSQNRKPRRPDGERCPSLRLSSGQSGLDPLHVAGISLRGFGVRGRTLQPLDRLLGVFRLRTVGQNLQITLVFLACLVGLVHFLQAHGQAERRERVVIFVE